MDGLTCTECHCVFTEAQLAAEDKNAWGHPCHGVAGEPDAECESFREPPSRSEGLSILIFAHDNTCAGNGCCTCEPTRKLIVMGENYVTKRPRDVDDEYALMELAAWGRGPN